MRCALALLIIAAQAGAETNQWLKLSTPGFRIFSQTTGRDLRSLAEQLGTAARILDALEPGASSSSNSVGVFIFESRQDFERYGADRKPTGSGYYHSSSGGEVIAFLHRGQSSRPVILHEYAHLAMHRAGGRMPRWLDEGLAEVYATIRISGKQVFWGGPADWRIPSIAGGRLLDASEFFEPAQNAVNQTDSSRAIFYAQSWAFTHMLQFGPTYSGGMATFRKFLAQNMPEAEAFERAFGKSRTVALAELPVYVSAGRFHEQPLQVTAPSLLAAGPESRCTREETAFALADLLLHLGRTDQAKRIYEELAGIEGSDAEAAKLLGDLALAQNRRDEARLHYQRAIDMGLQNAALHFEYAMLLRDEGAPPDRVQGQLELAIKFDQNLPGLLQFLGNRALDEGDHALAIQRFSRAALLQPEKSAVWLGLAYAHRAAGEREAARRAGQRAVELAQADTERDMAKAALAGLEEQAELAAASSGPKTIVPESWKNRQGDRRIEGALVRIDCEGTAARLYLRSAGRVGVFLVSDPRKVVLRNTPEAAREFRCGAFDDVNVVVEFISPPEARKDIAGDITAIEFK